MKQTRIFISLAVALVFWGIAAEVSLAQNQPPLKVALIFDIGGRGDGGFNDSAYIGLEKAVRELGVKAVYVEHKRNLEREQALNDAAASDAGMIIGVGFGFSEKLDKLAEKYPDKKFVCVDYSVKYDDRGRVVPPPANLSGLMFKEEEGSYLVGAIAALTSKTGKIGFIGGMDSPMIRKFQAGYLAGAMAVRPDIRVALKYAGITGRAFNDPQKGYRIAISMYREGADIIYHAAGATGAGLFRAAKRMKRLAIGVDVDQSAQAPGLVLSSMIKNIDMVVFESVQSWSDGKFTGGLKSLGLKEKGVGFVYNDQNRNLIAGDVLDQVLALQSKILSGELIVPQTGESRFSMSRDDLQELLSDLHSESSFVLKKLDRDIKNSARVLSGKDLKGDFARTVLKGLYAANPYIIDCETVSNSGIMLAVEPPAHRLAEGVDISAQAHMVKLFQTRQPVMSGSFSSVEGPQAVVIHHPIFSSDKKFAGSISALFAPEYLLSGIIGPVASNLPVGIFLMQTDGLLIYHVDTKHIGLNTFSDPLYQPFPDLIKFLRKMVAAPEGSGSYRFYLKDSSIAVTKVAYWRTITMHGKNWRLVVTCAEDNIEK